jgi:two-component system, LuxR family, response regulator FixJ
MSISTPTVILIDRDEAVRSAMKFAFELDGLRVETYATGEAAFFETFPRTGCLVVDQDLEDQTGMELIQDLRRRRIDMPAILIATNPGRSVRRAAAIDGVPVVEKPILSDALLNAVRSTLAVPKSRQ